MLNNNQIQLIKNIVNPILPNSSYKVFIFGSRATGKNRQFSDVDLGILGSCELDSDKISQITDEFEDSDLPFRVNVVDFAKVSDKFKEQALDKIISI